jgi:hypothetical protein
MVRACAKGMSSKWMGGGCWAMKGFSFLAVVGFSVRFLKRSVERLEVLAGEYQDCRRKRKSLLRTGALGIMGGYSQSENAALVRYKARQNILGHRHV